MTLLIVPAGACQEHLLHNALGEQSHLHGDRSMAHLRKLDPLRLPMSPLQRQPLMLLTGTRMMSC